MGFRGIRVGDDSAGQVVEHKFELARGSSVTDRVYVYGRFMLLP